jgi:hypothetical protein
LRRASEQGAGQAVVGNAEVRVVKDVEEFRSKTPIFLVRENSAVTQHLPEKQKNRAA